MCRPTTTRAGSEGEVRFQITCTSRTEVTVTYTDPPGYTGHYVMSIISCDNLQLFKCIKLPVPFSSYVVNGLRPGAKYWFQFLSLRGSRKILGNVMMIKTLAHELPFALRILCLNKRTVSHSYSFLKSVDGKTFVIEEADGRLAISKLFRPNGHM